MKASELTLGNSTRRNLASLFDFISFATLKSGRSKEETLVENPISRLVNDTVVEMEDDFTGRYEVGYTFRSAKNGMMDQLGIFMPSQGAFKVTLWKVNGKEQIAQATVVSRAKKKTFVNIAPVVIEADVDYIVSVNTTNITNGNESKFFVSRSLRPLYPITKNSITILGNREQRASAPEFPSNASCDNCIVGIVDFTFVADK